jgi:hypothetical protein
MKFVARLLALFVLASALNGSQTSNSTPRITDLFSADEKRNAGLSKLTTTELSALNAAIFRVLMELNSSSETARTSGGKSTSDSSDLVPR